MGFGDKSLKKLFFVNIFALTGILLFFFYSSLLFSAAEKSFFLFAGENLIVQQVSNFLLLWIFPMFSVLTGICAAKLLSDAEIKKYVLTVVKSLLIPFATGMIIFVPFQIFTGMRTAGSDMAFKTIPAYYQHLSAYFNNGGIIFLSNFWIFFYLAASCFILLFCRPLLAKFNLNDVNVHFILIFVSGFVFFLKPVFFFNNAADFLDVFLPFMYGAFLFQYENVQEKVKRNRHWLFACFLALFCFNVFLAFSERYGNALTRHVVSRALIWLGLLAGIAVFKRYFDKTSGFMKTVAECTVFNMYSALTLVIAVALVAMRFIANQYVLFFVVAIVAFLLSLLIRMLLGRFKTMQLLFGMRSELYNEII